ncbi:hypothetical protein GO491_06055 [Flavobacteriaceae bacterium Ap0902]|nr:hypothetical protein [Flavobacteriaceae bacterium Ap0902]
MKKIILLCLLVSSYTHAQVVISDNTEGLQQDNSAVLELDSKLGFLLPVMTEKQRDLIPVDTNSEGLLIYSLTTKSINIFDGEKWHVIEPQSTST